MTRYCAGFRRRTFVFVAAAAWLAPGSSTRAANDVWKTAASGTWSAGLNWVDGSSPSSIFDQATFNLAGAYTVSFTVDPDPIGALTVTNAANVTFASSSRPGNPIVPRSLSLVETSGANTGDLIVSGGATLTLGATTGGFPSSSHPFHLTADGDLSLNSGSTLNVRFGSDVVTSELTSDGQINVSGSGSTLNAGSMGIDGGILNVTAGGVVQNTGTGFVGLSAGDVGKVTVSGAGSQWINSTNLFVGGGGEGTLDITDRGKVQSVFGSIGGSSTAVGVVTVSGADSQWNNSSDLNVGNDGSGMLNVTGGGSVSCTDGFIGLIQGSDGTATVTGGAWTMTGRLSVAGDAVEGAAGGPGTLNIQPAGIVSAAQGVVLFPNAHVNLQGGTLDASSISYHQGIQGSQFQWTSGTLHVGTFNGSLTNSGGALAPGHSAGSTTINGNYTQVTEGALEIEIGGPLAGSEFDFVNVTNSAQINGELDLTLIGGFVPTPSQTFAILISNSLLGGFDNAPSGQRLTTSDGGGSFLVNYGVGSPFDDNQVVLSNFLAVALPGDYNQNGVVDAADYTVWRNGGSPDDTIAGYNLWRTNFGRTSGTGTEVTIPEPTSWLLVAIASVASLVRLRR